MLLRRHTSVPVYNNALLQNKIPTIDYNASMGETVHHNNFIPLLSSCVDIQEMSQWFILGVAPHDPSNTAQQDGQMTFQDPDSKCEHPLFWKLGLKIHVACFLCSLHSKQIKVANNMRSLSALTS